MEFFKLKFWAIPFAFASMQGFFLMLILFFHKSKTQLSRKLLSLLTFFIASILGYMALYISNELTNYPYLIWSTVSFWYIIGPLFYIYIKTRFKLKLKWYDALHFIPFLIKFIKLIPFYLRTSEEKIKIFEYVVLNNNLSYSAFLHYLVSALYILYSYHLLKNIEKKYKSSISSSSISIIEHQKKLAKIIGTSIIIIYVAILCSIYIDSYGIELDYIGLTCLSTLIYSIIITAIKEPNVIFSDVELKDYNNESEKTESNLIDLEFIYSYMKNNKPYLIPDLKLPHLAENLNLSVHKLSHILNNEIKQNFYDFVNSYRVEEAKQKLLDPKLSGFTILAIAQDSGFNSKASFNRIFKNSTGFTPSTYIKHQKKSA